MSSASCSICAASRSLVEIDSASSAQVAGDRVVAGADLAQQRAVDDEVGVAADRRGEVAVGGAREPGVAEVARVVARLLERAQDEARERLAAAARPARVLGDALARRGRDPGRLRRAHALGRGRGRHAEVGEPVEQPLDRVGLGRLVHAVERAAAPAREQLRRPARSRGSSAPRRARGRAARTRSRRARRRRARRRRTRPRPTRSGARRARSGAAAARARAARRGAAPRRPARSSSRRPARMRSARP